MADEQIVSSTEMKPEGLMDSIKGIFFGIILIPLALYLCYFGETRKEISSYVKRSVLMTPAISPTQDADVHFTGTPEADVVSDSAYGVGNAWYINRNVEVYKQVEKTRTVKKDGKDYEEKYLVNEWVRDPDESKIFSTPQFKFGPLTVSPTSAATWLEAKANNVLMPLTILGKPAGVAAALGDKRVAITGIKSASPLFIAGHFSNGTVAPNEDGMMVVSAMSEQETMQSLKSSDRFIFWAIKIFAFFLLYGGFMMVLGPVTWAFSWIPFIGDLGKGLMGFCMFVLSFIIIFSLSVLIHFFWWIVGVFVVLLVGIVVGAMTLSKKKAAA